MRFELNKLQNQIKELQEDIRIKDSLLAELQVPAGLMPVVYVQDESEDKPDRYWRNR